MRYMTYVRLAVNNRDVRVSEDDPDYQCDERDGDDARNEVTSYCVSQLLDRCLETDIVKLQSDRNLQSSFIHIGNQAFPRA